MNVSGTLNAFRLLFSPTLCLPHATISTFDRLPIPLASAFTISEKGGRPDIRAVVLDKDNCIAVPNANTIYPEYSEHFSRLRAAYPRALLIVSNSAGTMTQDPTGTDAALVFQNTGVPVLRHSTKKPGCGAEILAYFRELPELGITRSDQIAIVGDRLFTDVMMANMMGAWGVWVRDGVVREKSLITRFEGSFANFLVQRGLAAPKPNSQFEG